MVSTNTFNDLSFIHIEDKKKQGSLEMQTRQATIIKGHLPLIIEFS